MTAATTRSVDVSRPAPPPAGGRLDLPARRARRRALDALRALDAVGEPCAYRVVAPDGAALPPDQVTEQDEADVLGDLERLGAIEPTPLDTLVAMLEAVSSHPDRSRVAPALDRMLSYVDYWNVTSPARVAELFERLAPSLLVRAVGFTCATFLLAMVRSAVFEELLALDQWPVPAAGDADDRWQRGVAEMLCRKEASAEDVALVMAGIGARRVLPTDVAGGAMHERPRWPVGFLDARREGEQIAARLP